MTDLYGYFANGSEYDNDGGTVNEPRSKCCKSCAFTDSKLTVRPADVSLNDLCHFAESLDIFYCHEAYEDGKYRICKAWFDLFGDNVNNYFTSEKEIEDSRNKDIPCKTPEISTN